MKMRSKITLIAASVMLAASANAVEANLTVKDLPVLTPEVQHQTAAKRVTSRFTRSHYKQFKLDDQFSAEIFDRYLNMLDFSRNLFTQSEVDSFDTYRTQLDDSLKEGDNTIAFEMYNISMRKRFERYAFALDLLDDEIKFDVDESIELDRSEEAWPTDSKEIDELWRKRVKYDALNLALTDKEWPEIKEILTKRYNNAMKRISQSQSEDVFQLYMNAFSRQVDPHTSYLSPRNADTFQSEMNLSLEGIGAVLQMTDDYTVIRSLVAGGPAAGSKELGEGDKIVGVGQDGKEIVDVIGWRLDDVVDLIKGPKGTKVNLQILPDGKDAKTRVVTIVRDKVRLEDRAVKSEIIEKDGKKFGVLEVPSFYVGLSKDTDKLITELKEKNVDGILVDLRNNGGGALSEATALSGLFITSGPVVQVRDSYGRINVNADNGNAISYDGPLTVLVNRYSASASEIFAAAMQDYGRAVILGENSFGKGTVQQHRSLNHIYDLFDNELGYVQYTIQKFYRIDGGSTQNKGVIPDIHYPTPIDPAETGESVEDNALPWDSIEPAKYTKLSDESALIKKLTDQHVKRIQNDMEFGFIEDDIVRYKEEKDSNALSLNLKTREQESEKREAQRLERINERQKANDEEAFKSLDDVPSDYKAPDAYLDESISIMVDMLSDTSSS
ncbi:C-terminal processing peptidase [Vibrio breoganii]|uniref:carboxy terminal-processing peptidase n=1 Tax=Vibrio breoganii TaxID=553239 RepID=UPI000C8678D0|nr:carboxy terminal-processing peptidase [Vibrio breoganii]PMH16370.1 C-terminal processing peptidase [Vibrio breoganii]PMM13850.1 C-terminal processing peptidase [Vibrio breoganii]PMM41358.1 C-terminal processing peptidase [Vibrio breoganii]PMM84992.1 C-terminal processing peptidase [Vibrio breoganii]PMO94574.1 C-terminal processing peptidase [Vibrio breoganii]